MSQNTIKMCLEAGHKVTVARKYYGQDLLRLDKNGTIGDVLSDQVTGVEEEEFWCDTCNKGFDEHCELDGEHVRAPSLGDDI